MSSSGVPVRRPSGLRRKWLVALSGATLVAALGAVGLPAANAVHDTGAFELDGDATNGATPGDDWDNVCYQVAKNAGQTDAQAEAACSTTAGAPTATAVSFVTEPSLNSTIFTGGGSKDPQDISSWAWKDGAGGLPDKDNLLHSFAARYSLPPSTACPAGTSPTCDLLFFGSDRYDNSGDAQQGFWFFQNPIGFGTNSVGGGTGFTGVHRAGDILVISDFSNGGGTSTITVYKWDPTCLKAGGSCGDANLRTLESSTSAKCDPALASPDEFCGIVNPSDGTTSPWPFTDKSGLHTFLNGEFYEGGINLSTLGLAGQCFAAVASETRSSTSTTATLKDFVLGGFGDCTSHVTTVPKTGAGDGIPVGGLSIGSGTVDVKDSATVTVSGVSTWAGSVQFSLCGPFAADSTSVCGSGGTAIGSPVAITNATSQPFLSPAATVSSAGRYCWRADFTATTEGVPDGSDGTATECFVVTPVTPSLATTAGPDVLAGSTVSDTAVLTNYANKPGTPVINPTTAGGPAGGTITFTLYGPNDCTTVAFGPSSPIPVGTLSGTTDRGASVTSSIITVPGTYHWVASYSGDLPNTTSTSHNAGCTDSAEDVVVNAYNPTISTAQRWLPNDTATVSVGGGGNLAGSVRFRLYDNATCTGSALYDSGAVPLSGASPQQVSSANTTALTSSATVSWLVQYTSTNPAQTGVTSSCNTEHSTLTIDNGTP